MWGIRKCFPSHQFPVISIYYGSKAKPPEVVVEPPANVTMAQVVVNNP